MSKPFGPDRYSAEHERARRLAAERLAGILDERDAEWLVAHLAWCAPCGAVRDEYQAQRLELRSLRLDAPVVPRDLWARTAASLERERRRRRSASRTPGTTVVRGRNQIPLGVTSGLVVIALVAGATMLGGTRVFRPTPSTTPREDGPKPNATPFPVPIREVGLYSQLADGRLALVTGRVNEVCPLDVGPSCTSARAGARRVIDVGVSRTHAVLESPTRSQLVVVGPTREGPGVDVFVVPVAAATVPGPTPPSPVQREPGDGSSPAAIATNPDVAAIGSTATGITGSPVPGTAADSPALEIPDSPVLDGSGGAPESDASLPPAQDASASNAQPGLEDEPATTAPSDGSAGTDEVAPEAAPPTAPGSVSPSPVPGVDTHVRIASDVFVVGDVGEYNADGSAFAFTARPADGSHGPDVFLWRAGEPEALAVTNDHASVFADWIGASLLISRVSGDVGPDGTQQPLSVLVDPASGIQRLVPIAPSWRPTVDPTARSAVWWDGSVRRDGSGAGWLGAQGDLVLGTWRGGSVGGDGAPGHDGSPGPALAPDVLAEGPIGEWQVRWDETGTRLAVWIADAPNATVGRLSLYGIDAATGRVDRDAVLLENEAAGSAFSMGGGRLAWARPEADGTSRVVVLAWTEGQIGEVELAAEGEPLAVVR